MGAGYAMKLSTQMLIIATATITLLSGCEHINMTAQRPAPYVYTPTALHPNVRIIYPQDTRMTCFSYGDITQCNGANVRMTCYRFGDITQCK